MIKKLPCEIVMIDKETDSTKTSSKLTREHGFVLWALIAGICLPLLDTTIMGVAIPELAASLNAPISLLQWVSTSYTLAAACAVPICAWATRRLGGRALWVGGLVLFATGSAAAGLSDSVGPLIASRIVQGIGAGILMPVMQSILLACVGHARLKTAMATVGVPAVLAPIAGPVVGSFLLQWGPWQLIFWVNVPIACLTLGLAFRFLEKDAGSFAEKFDFPGFLLLLPALGLTVFGLAGISGIAETKSMTGESGMASVGAIIAGMVFLSCFTAHALRSKNPLLDIRLFRVLSFHASMWLLFFSSFVFYGGIFLFPLFLMNACAQGPMLAALLVGVHGLGALISRFYLEAATKRCGVGNTALMAIVGTAMGTAALCLPAVLQFPVAIGMALLLRGAGVGWLTLLAMSHAYHAIARHKVPDASSLSRVVTLLGASVGTASVAVLYQISTRFGWDAFRPALIGLFVLAVSCTLPAMVLKRAR
ncbi:MFS transporter [Verminephrobacter aporrectodeae subsp. tuberculatae]|nr:MFS transporter [Verminephrobacter aporrectodeae subsp. tuberculatae]